MTSATTLPRPSAARGKPDQICAEAVDLARAAVTEDVAGAHLEVVAEGERVVTHYFECSMPGYQGWRWAVTVARAPRSKQVTISETALLPGPDALTTPAWVPWNERLQPGDLGVGDLMPTPADDERLVPGYLLSDDPAVEDVVWEIGLGRVRVLSREGRVDAAERWHEGDQGPQAPIALAAPPNARCVSCGFYLPLAGSMRALFGVCANVFAPDDGRVVSGDHGCGAHSEVLVDTVVEVDEAPTVYDDAEVEVEIASGTGFVAETQPEAAHVTEAELIDEATPATFIQPEAESPQAPPSAAGATVVEAESGVDSEPVVEAGPIADPEPVAEVGPVVEAEPVAEVGPVADTGSVVDPEPVAEVGPVADTGSVVDSEAVGEVEPAAEAEQVVAAEPVPQVGPVLGAESIVDSEPVGEVEPAVEAGQVVAAEPVPQVGPVLGAESVVDTEPVAEVGPVADTESIADIEPVVEAGPVARAEVERRLGAGVELGVEAEPLAELSPTADHEPDKEDQPVAETAPVTTTEPVVVDEPFGAVEAESEAAPEVAPESGLPAMTEPVVVDEPVGDADAAPEAGAVAMVEPVGDGDSARESGPVAIAEPVVVDEPGGDANAAPETGAVAMAEPVVVDEPGGDVDAAPEAITEPLVLDEPVADGDAEPAPEGAAVPEAADVETGPLAEGRDE